MEMTGTHLKTLGMTEQQFALWRVKEAIKALQDAASTARRPRISELNLVLDSLYAAEKALNEAL